MRDDSRSDDSRQIESGCAECRIGDAVYAANGSAQAASIDSRARNVSSVPVKGRVGIVIVNYSAKCADGTGTVRAPMESNEPCRDTGYSTERPLLRCLASLRTLDYPDFFVVVIDNASPDGSGVRLRNRVRGPGVEVILNPENRGFAAACNVGMRYAVTRGADYLWLLNPDTTVEPDTLTNLVDASLRAAPSTDGRSGAGRAAGYGAVCGSKVLYGDTDLRRVWSAGGEVDFSAQQVSMHGWNELDDGRFDEGRDCAYLPGCSLLVPHGVLDLVGYLPEEYFLYFEETTWCTEMRRRGVPLRYAPRSVVRHYFDDPKLSSPQTVYYYNRNERLFFYRYGSQRQRIALMLRTILRDIPRATRALRAAPGKGQRAVFRAQRRAYWDFVRGRFGPAVSLRNRSRYS